MLLAVVGVCSLSFHTFATAPTAALDSLSILASCSSPWCCWPATGSACAPGGPGWPRPRSWPSPPSWTGCWRWAGQYTLGGYLPALLGLAGFAVALRSRRLIVATVVFAVSLSLRTLDQPLCDRVPSGCTGAGTA